MSKPTLYLFGGSVWSAVPELAMRELGYKPGDLNIVTITLPEGENFNPWFVKINPNATLPTLSIDGNVYANTIDVTKYLIANAPQTPGKTSGTDFVTRIHKDNVDPNFALLAARNDEELSANASGMPFAFLSGRQATLEGLLADPDASDHHKFYQAKSAGNGSMIEIYKGSAPQRAKDDFFAKSANHWESIRKLILEDIPGVLPTTGFIGGDKPGEDDFHLGAWLSRIVTITGGNDVRSLSTELGQDVPKKIEDYWKAWSQRASWKDVYINGLH